MIDPCMRTEGDLVTIIGNLLAGYPFSPNCAFCAAGHVQESDESARVPRVKQWIGENRLWNRF